jgi:hypothetical protein
MQELELLGNLYGLFQKFLRFDDRFRDTLWAEVDLDSATREVSGMRDGEAKVISPKNKKR